MNPFQDNFKELWGNFLGEYRYANNWLTNEGTKHKSKMFVKLTALKCNTAHAKIMDLSFPEKNGSIPYKADAVVDAKGMDPKIVEDYIHKTKSEIDDHFRRIELDFTPFGSVLSFCSGRNCLELAIAKTINFSPIPLIIVPRKASPIQ